jgi:hypothetical protein
MEEAAGRLGVKYRKRYTPLAAYAAELLCHQAGELSFNRDPACTVLENRPALRRRLVFF